VSYIQFPATTPVFPVLPPLTWSVHKKPILASRATTAISGRETKLACCVYPRWEFVLSYGGGNSWLRDQTQNIVPAPGVEGFTELQQLLGLFLQCQGSYGEFYYSDPDDSSRSAAPLGTGGGTSNETFQIMVPWGSGPFSTPFSFPAGGIASLDAVYYGGTPYSSSQYNLQTLPNGCFVEITADAPAGAAITADFHFYYRCRFSDDTMNYAQFLENLWDVKEVRFESVKP